MSKDLKQLNRMIIIAMSIIAVAMIILFLSSCGAFNGLHIQENINKKKTDSSKTYKRYRSIEYQQSIKFDSIKTK